MPVKGLVVVTGATGHQGGTVARELIAAGHAVRVMTRKPDSAAARALGDLGAEVVHGDLDEASSLAGVLEGAWATFAVQNTWEAGVEKEEEQGKRYAEEARRAGIEHYVYSSVGSAHRDTGIPHFDNKWRIEQRVRELGFPSWTVIRPVFFMDNFLSPLFKPEIEKGNLVVGLQPATKLQMIAVPDIGKYGKLAFEQHDRWNGRSVDIAGDELTMGEVAAIISEAAKRPVKFVQASVDEIRKSSDDYATMLEWFDAVGYNVDIAGNAKEYGIPPTRFRDWASRQDWG